MADANSSIKLKSLYVTRFLLEIAGVLLVVLAMFCFFLAYAEPKGRHGGGGFLNMTVGGLVSLICGIGLLLPQVWAKLCSSLLLTAFAIWTFLNDGFRWSNLAIYSLFLVPLFLAFWLKHGYSTLQLRRLPSAH